MSRYTVECCGYPDAMGINGAQELRVNCLSCLHAMIHVGKGRRNIQWMPRLYFSPLYLVNRIFLGLSTFTSLIFGDQLCTTNFYQMLEQTDKNQVTSILGAAFAWLSTRSILKIQWLAHFRCYMEYNGLDIKGKYPDYIGKDDSDAWHLVEAKGTDQRGHPEYTANALRQGKKQLNNPNIRLNAIRSVVATTCGGEIRCIMKDPSPGKEYPDPSFNGFLDMYYAPYKEYLDTVKEATITIKGDSYRYGTIIFGDCQLIVGLNKKAYLHQGSVISNYSEELRKNHVAKDDLYIGTDGVLLSIKHNLTRC